MVAKSGYSFNDTAKKQKKKLIFILAWVLLHFVDAETGIGYNLFPNFEQKMNLVSFLKCSYKKVQCMKKN